MPHPDKTLLMNSSFLNDEDNDKDYIPGTCNIGVKEVQRRKFLALLSFTGTIIAIIILQKFELPKVWRLAVFIPLWFFILNFLQSYFKFCVFFGIKGLFNFNDIRRVKRIKKEEDRNKDAKKGWQIIFASIVIAFIFVILYFYLLV